MKRNEEIVSLNVVHFEQKEEMDLNERLERLTNEAMKSVVAGGDPTCPAKCLTMQGCDRECDNNCDFNCACDGFEDYCTTMGGLT
ncbi:hypothetical protein [Bacteroides rodentium]